MDKAGHGHGSTSPERMATVPTPPRSVLIDVVRGIAICLVVLGHTNQGLLHRGWWGQSLVGYHLNDSIYAFHMPAFFFVSGIFLRPGVDKRGMKRYTAEKLRTMIYPFLVWATIIYLAERFFLARYIVTHIRSTHEFLLGLVTADLSWFLPTIFLAVMAGMLVRKLPMPLVFIATVLMQIFMPDLHAADLNALFRFLPFLILGMWVGRGFQVFERLAPWMAGLGGLLLAATIVAYTSLPLAKMRWSLAPMGIVGIVMLLLFSKALGRGAIARALAWAGEGSFGIFLMSEFPQGGGRALVEKLLHTTAPVPQLIIPSVLAVVIPCWIYQYRVRLHIGWLFVWPFSRQGAMKRVP